MMSMTVFKFKKIPYDIAKGHCIVGEIINLMCTTSLKPPLLDPCLMGLTKMIFQVNWR